MRAFAASSLLVLVVFVVSGFGFFAGLAFRHWLVAAACACIWVVTTFLLGPALIQRTKRRVPPDELTRQALTAERTVAAMARAVSGGWNPKGSKRAPPDS